MRFFPAGTDRRTSGRIGRPFDRLAAVLASALLVLAAVALTAAYALHSRTQAHEDALRGENPADLVLVPSGAAAPSTTVTPVADTAIVPTHLYVPAIGIDTTVAAKPTQRTDDPFLHRMIDSFGVPDDMYSTTWWSSGPEPGSDAMAVILGHTQINGYGVFNRLGRLRPGASISVTGPGASRRFTVLAVHTGISKTDPEALRHALEAHPAAARLALITCSGTFDTRYDQSTQNTVVFARTA